MPSSARSVWLVAARARSALPVTPRSARIQTCARNDAATRPAPTVPAARRAAGDQFSCRSSKRAPCRGCPPCSDDTCCASASSYTVSRSLTAFTPGTCRTQRSRGRTSSDRIGPVSVTWPRSAATSTACGCDTTRPSSALTRPTSTSSDDLLVLEQLAGAGKHAVGAMHRVARRHPARIVQPLPGMHHLVACPRAATPAFARIQKIHRQRAERPADQERIHSDLALQQKPVQSCRVEPAWLPPGSLRRTRAAPRSCKLRTASGSFWKWTTSSTRRRACRTATSPPTPSRASTATAASASRAARHRRAGERPRGPGRRRAQRAHLR